MKSLWEQQKCLAAALNSLQCLQRDFFGASTSILSISAKKKPRRTSFLLGTGGVYFLASLFSKGTLVSLVIPRFNSEN